MKFWILYLLCTIIVNSAKALDMSDDGIYKSIKTTCTKINASDLKKGSFKHAAIRLGYYQSDELKEMIHYLKLDTAKQVISEFNFNINPWIEIILSSKGYNQALNECYNGSIEMNNFFKNLIISSDRIGRILGVVAVGISLYGFGKFPKILNYINSYVAKIYEFLNKALVSILGVSLLKSDSVKETSNNQNITGRELQQLVEQAKSQMGDKELYRQMLREQIAEVESQINKCGDCSDSQNLTTEIEFLNSLLN